MSRRQHWWFAISLSKTNIGRLIFTATKERSHICMYHSEDLLCHENVSVVFIVRVTDHLRKHDDVIISKHFPRYWPFVRGIHRSPVNSPHKGQWRGALMLSLICAWINGWVNNSEAGDLRRHQAHYDVIVMTKITPSEHIKPFVTTVHSP